MNGEYGELLSMIMHRCFSVTDFITELSKFKEQKTAGTIPAVFIMSFDKIISDRIRG